MDPRGVRDVDLPPELSEQPPPLVGRTWCVLHPEVEVMDGAGLGPGTNLELNPGRTGANHRRSRLLRGCALAWVTVGSRLPAAVWIGLFWGSECRWSGVC